MGGGFLYVESWSINQLVMMFLESMFVCAVNLFVLITGYFIAGKKSSDLIKPLSLIAQVIIYAVMFYMITIIARIRQFDFLVLASCFVPNNWFVILYSALVVVSPFLNQFLDSISEKVKINMIIVLGIVFFLYPTLADIFSLWTGNEFLGLSTIGMYGSQDGYTIVNFILIYIIGNALKDIKPDKQIKQVLELITVVLFIFGWSLLDNAMMHEQHSSWAYCNPLVVIEAVLVFQIFRNISIEHNRIINRLAGASFSVYVIHTKIIGHIGIEHFVNKNIVIILAHLLCCCVVIYLVSWVLFEVYSILMEPWVQYLQQNWKKNRFISIS